MECERAKKSFKERKGEGERKGERGREGGMKKEGLVLCKYRFKRQKYNRVRKWERKGDREVGSYRKGIECGIFCDAGR